MVMTCEIVIAYSDHMSIYVINRETIEKALRAGSCEEVNELIVNEGMLFPAECIEQSDIFFDMKEPDEESFGCFQNALMDYVCDVEEDMKLNIDTEDAYLMAGGNPE